MNDEVKLILTKLKIVSEEKENGLYLCNKKDSKLLLSYIEQLENNRDKAIEFIEIELSQGGERDLRDLVDSYEVLKLLKGDSDGNL